MLQHTCAISIGLVLILVFVSHAKIISHKALLEKKSRPQKNFQS